MSTDWPHYDRKQLKRAREAAEALFKPRPQVARAETPLAATGAPSSSEQPAPRTPRVIAIPSMTPVRDQKVETPAMAEPAMMEPELVRMVVAAITLVDMDAAGLDAGQLLQIGDDRPDGVAALRPDRRALRARRADQRPQLSGLRRADPRADTHGG